MVSVFGLRNMAPHSRPPPRAAPACVDVPPRSLERARSAGRGVGRGRRWRAFATDPIGSASGAWASTSRRTRRVAAGAFGGVSVVLVVALVLTVGLTPQFGATPAPKPVPPLVLAAAGTNWSIPGDHYYEYRQFSLNRSASVQGGFTASAVVQGYVMDSLDYPGWPVVGRVVSYGHASGNVTSAHFAVPLNFTDRFYLILVNTNPNATGSVDGSSACVVVYSAVTRPSGP